MAVQADVANIANVHPTLQVRSKMEESAKHIEY